jgi:acetoin utilization protein AcuC
LVTHHGNGVYFGFEEDERVVIGDIHEDGRFLYPGTGSVDETGTGKAKGTKLNISLPSRSGDEAFISSFEKIEKFIESFEPEFIFFQCGADGLKNDPITHLEYSAKAHRYAAKKLHELSHKTCDGKIVAMGGGGYNPENVRDAWVANIKGLSEKEES